MYCIKLLFNIKLKRTSVCVFVCTLSYYTHSLTAWWGWSHCPLMCLISGSKARVHCCFCRHLPNENSPKHARVMWRHCRSRTETHSQPINTLAALTSYVKKKRVCETTKKADILFFKMYKNPMKICKHKNWYVKLIHWCKDKPFRPWVKKSRGRSHRYTCTEFIFGVFHLQCCRSL